LIDNRFQIKLRENELIYENQEHSQGDCLVPVNLLAKEKVNSILSVESVCAH